MSAPLVDSFMTACPFAIEADLTLERAIRWFEVKRLLVAPVTQNGKIIGTISKSSLVRAQSDQKKRRDISHPTVADFSSPIVVAVEVDAPAYEVIAQMAKLEASCAVVMRHSKVIGLVSMANVFESFSAMLRARGLTHQTSEEPSLSERKIQ
ncbi:MAG: CBS domain-containing protein [Bdellovibrionales bacterium]|nr:CBS domain-containing protein [Bdellovibrionales bacterium]